MKYEKKKSLVETLLVLFGVVFEKLSKCCREFQAELDDWEDGWVFAIGVLPNGPWISLKKEGGVMRYLGKGRQNPRLTILFKNLDCALFPLMGSMGADTAFIQRRAILHGNIAEAMQVSRAMAIVQAYTLPGFVLKKICKRPPKLTPRQLLLKARILAGLAPRLLANRWKVSGS